MRHRRLPRLDLPNHSYYLTACTRLRRRILGDPSVAESLIRLYARERDQCRIKLHGYVVMADHYHVLLTLLRDASVSAVVRAVHSLLARECRGCDPGVLGRRQAPAPPNLTAGIWQSRFYDHVIRSESELWEKLGYLHGNPIRAGLVKAAVEYPWSSARFWETGTGVVRCDPLVWDEV